MKRQSEIAIAIGLLLAVPAFADIATASGAGDLPATAQDLSADLSLTGIVGMLAFPDGVNVFKIDIPSAVDFSAYTIPLAFGVPDPELFLFDANGLGVYENDDASGGNTQSCLPSDDAANPCSSSRGGAGPLTAGIYYLAITRSTNSPLSVSGYIFSPVLSTDVVGPDPTQGGGDPVNGWDGFYNTGADTDLVNYDIIISDTAPVPEPSSWALTAAVAGFVLFRRKLFAR